MRAGTQTLGPFSVFPGTLVGCWIGNRAAGTETRALIWNANIESDGLILNTKMSDTHTYPKMFKKAKAKTSSGVM